MVNSKPSFSIDAPCFLRERRGISIFWPKGYQRQLNTLTFDTAWSSPQPVIAALAEKFPALHFSHKWADENFGYNVGEKEYTDGEESFSNVPEGGSKEALELAAEVHDLDLADEGYLYNETTGQYEYHDPEEAPMSVQLQ